jgi:hypothetical protein
MNERTALSAVFAPCMGEDLLKGVGFIFAYGCGTLLCSIFLRFAQITKKKDVQASGHYPRLAAFWLHNHISK